MSKEPVLSLDVGQTERHQVDVYFTSRRSGVEVCVDGVKVTPVPLRRATKGTDRYDVRVGVSEPHTVRIERLEGRRAEFQASIDGWPAPDARAARQAERLQADAVKRLASGKESFRKRIGSLAFAVLTVALIVWGGAIFVRNQINDASIANHGKVITARIVDTEHDTSSDGTNDYLDVWIPACTCAVQIATDKPAAHPKGSTIGVLYDTTDPTNVRPLVDGNSAIWGWLFDAMMFGVAAFCLVCGFFLVKPESAELRAIRKRLATSSAG